MSVTPVKIGGAGSTTSAQTSIVAALTTGASIGDVVVFIASVGTAKQGTLPTDTKSNTWHLIAQPQSGTTASCNMWYSVLTAALTTSDTITTTWTGSVARRSWTVLKCSGLTAFDISGTANAATATSLSLSTGANIAQADELVLAAYGWDETASTTNAVMSADAGYTLLDQELAGGGGTNQIGCGVEWKETSSIATVTASPTMNETCAGLAGVIAAFTVASSGTAYTDSGILPLTLAVSGTDSADSSDAGTLPLTLAMSGVDAAGSIDAGALAVTLAISGVDSIGSSDSGMLPLTLAVSGADSAGSSDAGTLPLTIAISGSETYTPAAGGTAYTDAGTIPLTFALSGVDAAGSSDSGTLPFTLSVTGSDSIGSSNSGTLPFTFAVSGTSSVGSSDSGAIPLAIGIHGADSAGSIDAGVLALIVALSGSETYTPAGAQIVTAVLTGYVTVGATGTPHTGSIGQASVGDTAQPLTGSTGPVRVGR